MGRNGLYTLIGVLVVVVVGHGMRSVGVMVGRVCRT